MPGFAGHFLIGKTMAKYFSGICACAAALALTSCMPFDLFSGGNAQADPAVSPETVEAAPAPAPSKARSDAAVKKDVKAQSVKPASSGQSTAKKSSSKGAASEEKIRAELDKFLVQYTNHANKSMNGSRAKPKVIKRRGLFVAQFTEIDPASVHADMRKSKSKHFDYVASMHYIETSYECAAKTQKAALKGPFKVTRVRNLTELPRYYKGKWEN